MIYMYVGLINNDWWLRTMNLVVYFNHPTTLISEPLVVDDRKESD
jgi:hypothetical protein